MRNELTKAVKKTQEEELKAANEKFRQFTSTHEGYAVILEEAQEAEDELRSVAANLQALWVDIKNNTDKERVKTITERVEAAAQLMAAEAIQTAAMARKLLDFLAADEA